MTLGAAVVDKAIVTLTAFFAVVVVTVMPQPRGIVGAMSTVSQPPMTMPQRQQPRRRRCHGVAVQLQRVGGGPLRRQASPLFRSPFGVGCVSSLSLVVGADFAVRYLRQLEP